jgi:hypothetical protein
MDDQLFKLAKGLLEKTVANQANWVVTSVADQFALQTRNGTVLTDYYKQKMGYGLSVLTKTGLEVRKAYAEPGSSDFVTLKSLYDAAFNQYHRVDKTFEEILREVGEAGPIGFDEVEDDFPF